MAGFLRVIVCAMLAWTGAAFAQVADPTAPPAGWLSPGDDAGDAAASGTLRLQSVLLPQRGRAVAVIGGKTVAVGERIGEATLIRLTEREAVLQGADGVTHLYLTPDVEKHMIQPPKSRKAGKSGHVKDLP